MDFLYPKIDGLAGENNYLDLVFGKSIFTNGEKITNYIEDRDFNSNIITGTNQNDWVNSRSYGDDTLDGGAGRDILTKAGHYDESETFYFSSVLHSTSNQADLIMGFDEEDIIDLSAVGITNINQLDIQYFTLEYYSGIQDVLTEIKSKVNDFAVTIINYDEFGSFKFAGSNNLYDFDGNFVGSSTTKNSIIQGKSLADNMSSGAGNDTVYGNDGDDIINGNQDNDSIHGGNGNDQLRGGRDQDFVQGNSGNDYLYGDKGLDTIRGGQGNDYIQGNSENDLLYGDKGNDTIRGGQGNDTIYGGDGNDSIYGDKGNDIIYGNSGSDVFIFNSNTGIDVVNDFNASEGDKIQISASIYASVELAYNAINFDNISGNAALNLGGINQVALIGVSESDINISNIVLV